MLSMVLLHLLVVSAGLSLVFLAYLCHLWYASSRLPPEAAAAPALEEKAGNGLSASQLLSLPGAEDGLTVKGTECTVCLDDIEAGQAARVLPGCHHAFHRPCVDLWLSGNPGCPICRNSLLPAPPDPVPLAS